MDCPAHSPHFDLAENMEEGRHAMRMKGEDTIFRPISLQQQFSKLAGTAPEFLQNTEISIENRGINRPLSGHSIALFSPRVHRWEWALALKAVGHLGTVASSFRSIPVCGYKQESIRLYYPDSIKDITGRRKD
ncbi:hypothetical protein AVEN_265181-1 [Araneus ventricosus]|uniref:Uncharacterized protein n=1 Tax=Araneus ventricosus TaxID=182803 RepID=A0A4Y2CQG8_ARAVE|nr:hypothetical protein AVEN_265181-1 [Araneus ventricosus]